MLQFLNLFYFLIFTELLEKITPKKSLGQHFLHDKNIARNIVELLDVPDNALVLEIGSGTGVLTDFLLAKNIQLISVEIDHRSVEILQQKYSDFLGKNYFIYENDFLKIDLRKISEEFGKKIYVIGNIPYYITSPILFHLFDYSDYLVKSVLMVQKEIAQRLKAKQRTKDYGILSLALQNYGKISKVHDVPASCFLPPPKVTSAYFDIVFHKENEGIVPSEFRKKVHRMIRIAFQQRRKKLSNCLKSYFSSENIDFNDLPESIEKYFSQRPEELSLQEFYNLFLFLEKYRK